MTNDPYLYPGTDVLRNKLEITSAEELDAQERRFVTARSMQGVPKGSFDLDHLRAIHRHLFQDIYDWAGKLRTVEISKDGHQFQFRQYIETGMGDGHRRLVKADFLKGLSSQDFATRRGTSSATCITCIPSVRATAGRSFNASSSLHSRLHIAST
jgi:cell filamentation protein